MEINIKFEASGRIVPYVNEKEITMNESPFLLFLATAGMCSAVYVRAFMAQRGMNYLEVELTQKMNYSMSTNMVSEINMEIKLPSSFPEKYVSAIKNVVAQCPVKKHLAEPPAFTILTV